MLKALKYAGIAACVLLIVSTFLPWTYHADVGKNFTGFYSEVKSGENFYGRPGKFLVGFGILAGIFMILPKIWAKRINLFLSAIFLGYAIKSYILFTSCYYAYCPEKKAGIFLMLGSCIVILAAAIFPDMKIQRVKGQGTRDK